MASTIDARAASGKAVDRRAEGGGTPSTRTQRTKEKRSLNYMVLLVFFFVCRENAARRRRSSQAAVIKTLEALVVRVRDEAQEVVLDGPDRCYLGRVAHDT